MVREVRMRRYLGIGIVVLCIWLVVAARLFSHSNSDDTSQTKLQKAFPGMGSEADWETSFPYYKEAIKQYKSNNYDQALQLAQQAVSKYPYSADFYNLQAVVFLTRNGPGDAQNAEALLRKGLEYNKDSMECWDTLGKCLASSGRLQDARQAFEKALQCNPPREKAEEIKVNLDQIDKALGQ
jgi:Flp pilus assembly protein TadD